MCFSKAALLGFAYPVLFVLFYKVCCPFAGK